MKIFLIAFFLLSYFGTQASQDAINLIEKHVPQTQDLQEALHFYGNREVVIRFQEVEINNKFRQKDAIRSGDKVSVQLFDDTPFLATVERVGQNVNGTISMTALLEEDDGYLVMATTGDRTLVTVYFPKSNLFYKIISEAETKRHFLIEMDARERDILESSPPLIPELDESELLEQKRLQERLEGMEKDPEDWVNIDVMVLYTPNAEIWANVEGGGIDNLVAVAMANAQLVLDNSNVNMTATLIHSDLLSYNESDGGGGALSHITGSALVHNLRNTHNADLVALFARVSDTGGVAWLLNDRNGTPTRGFSVTRVQQAATGYTHIHEMGHNMGCHHHIDQNFQPGPTPWTNWPQNRWSAGWRWTGSDGGHYCTVMTYTHGSYYGDGITHTEVPYFSNPDILYEDVPTGHPHDGDNARTLREIKHVIAAYRVSGMTEVFTAHVADIELLQASSGGTIVPVNGHEIIRRGVVWDTEPNPTLERHEGMTEDGDGDGEFTSLLTELSPSTNYYVVAYAETESYVAYGVQRVFQTLIAVNPNVRTKEAKLVTHNSAHVGGDVFFTGNSEVTQRGVVWSSQVHNPSLTNNEGITDDGTGGGKFSTIMTGLKPETHYYYRAYATNLGGTVYGHQEEILTLHARIFPNPFIEWLNVEFYNESREPIYIVLTNSRGSIVKRRKVESEGDVSKQLNVAHLSGGIYTLSIESQFEFPTWQLLKLHE